jgi:hypothetical protein
VSKSTISSFSGRLRRVLPHEQLHAGNHWQLVGLIRLLFDDAWLALVQMEDDEDEDNSDATYLEAKAQGFLPEEVRTPTRAFTRLQTIPVFVSHHLVNSLTIDPSRASYANFVTSIICTYHTITDFPMRIKLNLKYRSIPYQLISPGLALY